ncbi:hypothetical protein F8388_011071 [Cannabis sativa]|uniref:DUF4283 domain-containing protein n=1 Tax=Cannabis sativa TaxID=3483 RepID=A0A7J6F382_CANSA|nr:hypothetical protein F8388_011071 [Cannabis sativa]
MNEDDLATFYKEIALDDDEADINIDVVDQSLLDEGVMVVAKMIVGRVISTRSVDCNDLIYAVNNFWKIQGSFTVKARGMNMFVFHFDLITDRKRVLEGGPWVFKHCLLELKEPDDVLAPTKMVFDYALFWIQIHKVLVCCMTKAWGFELGKSAGEVLDVLCGPNGLCTGVFMKVRVSVDVHKPLVRVIRRRLALDKPLLQMLLSSVGGKDQLKYGDWIRVLFSNKVNGHVSKSPRGCALNASASGAVVQVGKVSDLMTV